MNRSTQAIPSDMCVPLGVVTENATCSAPCASRMRAMCPAISSSASSQPISRHAAGAPLGDTRRSGTVSRSG